MDYGGLEKSEEQKKGRRNSVHGLRGAQTKRTNGGEKNDCKPVCSLDLRNKQSELSQSNVTGENKTISVKLNCQEKVKNNN